VPSAQFPDPFKIVVSRMQRTPELLRGLTSLRTAAHDLDPISRVSPADWVFHMSVAYCSSLTPLQWADVTHRLRQIRVTTGNCVCSEAEIVCFDDGREYSGGVIPLTGPFDNIAS
jgi:hypothetical protein